MNYLACVAMGIALACQCNAQGLTVQAPGVAVQVAPTCVGCRPLASPAVPPVLYRPKVTYQPYHYQGSAIVERRYATPVRNWFFGRWRGYHYYAPMQQGSPQ